MDSLVSFFPANCHVSAINRRIISAAHRSPLLAGRKTEVLLVDAAEMLRVVVAEGVGDFAHRASAGQHLVGSRHQETAQEEGGRLVREGLHKVAEVVGREAQLAGTVAHCRQPLFALKSTGIIVAQQPLEPLQQPLRLSEGGLHLCRIVAGYVFQHQGQTCADDVGGVAVGSGLLQLKFKVYGL